MEFLFGKVGEWVVAGLDSRVIEWLAGSMVGWKGGLRPVE